MKNIFYRTTTSFRAILMLCLDVVGYLLLFLYTLHRRRCGEYFALGQVKKIAMLRLDGIGDVVLSTGAFKAVRKLLPEAKVTLFVSRWAEGLGADYERQF